MKLQNCLKMGIILSVLFVAHIALAEESHIIPIQKNNLWKSIKKRYISQQKRESRFAYDYAANKIKRVELLADMLLKVDCWAGETTWAVFYRDPKVKFFCFGTNDPNTLYFKRDWYYPQDELEARLIYLSEVIRHVDQIQASTSRLNKRQLQFIASFEETHSAVAVKLEDLKREKEQERLKLEEQERKKQQEDKSLLSWLSRLGKNKKQHENENVSSLEDESILKEEIQISAGTNGVSF